VLGMEGLEEGDLLLHPRSHTVTNQHSRHLSRARARAHAHPHTRTHAHYRRTSLPKRHPRDTRARATRALPGFHVHEFLPNVPQFDVHAPFRLRYLNKPRAGETTRDTKSAWDRGSRGTDRRAEAA
jgi:hypothetical protein